jgi:hypothetical protein
MSGPFIPDPMAGLLPPGQGLFISADRRVFRTEKEAVEASLSAEDAGGYGAGCSQSPENVTPQKSGQKQGS